MPKIPTSFVPRDYQLPIWEAFIEQRTHKRGLLVWPRRHGKDLTCMNILAYWALLLRVGNYYYYAPTYKQGMKIVWDGKDKDGKPFLSVFPGYPKTYKEDPDSVIESIDNREMKIKFRNGSMFQIIGTDQEDSLVGANPVGCVFSEYSIMNPKAWELVRPILVENEGWALFTYTARGRNHGYRLYDLNKARPSWHTEFHTVETAKHDGRRIVTDEMIQEERESGMTEDLIRQEFYNDWYASNMGAYYAAEMRRALEEGRITQVPWDPALPVHTAWDLGMSDATAIWFFQVDYNRNVNLIDFHSASGVSMLDYIKHCKGKPYVYGTHFAPHDVKVREFSTGKSRLEIALNHGFRFVVLPKLGVQDGIDAARALIPRCRFDEAKCDEGVEALRQYSKEESGLYDMNGRPIFRDAPKHDWSSHPADSFRYLSIAVDKVMCDNSFTDHNGDVISLPDEVISDYDIHGY